MHYGVGDNYKNEVPTSLLVSSTSLCTAAFLTLTSRIFSDLDVCQEQCGATSPKEQVFRIEEYNYSSLGYHLMGLFLCTYIGI